MNWRRRGSRRATCSLLALNEMLERWSDQQQTVDDLKTIIRLIETDQLHEAYMFTNYTQGSELEYKMPWTLWTWLIDQQRRDWQLAGEEDFTVRDYITVSNGEPDDNPDHE